MSIIRDIIGNPNLKNSKKNNNNILIENSILRFNKNMNTIDSKNSLQNSYFENINSIENLKVKPFQINKFRLLENISRNNNSYKNNTLNSLIRWNETNPNSRIKFKEKNNLNNNFVNSSNNALEIQKKNQLYSKKRININQQINNPNYILSTDNNTCYNNKNINSNRKILHNNMLSQMIYSKELLATNDNKISLTQKNKDIFFAK